MPGSADRPPNIITAAAMKTAHHPISIGTVKPGDPRPEEPSLQESAVGWTAATVVAHRRVVGCSKFHRDLKPPLKPQHVEHVEAGDAVRHTGPLTGGTVGTALNCNDASCLLSAQEVEEGYSLRRNEP